MQLGSYILLIIEIEHVISTQILRAVNISIARLTKVKSASSTTDKENIYFNTDVKMNAMREEEAPTYPNLLPTAEYSFKPRAGFRHHSDNCTLPLPVQHSRHSATLNRNLVGRFQIIVG